MTIATVIRLRMKMPKSDPLMAYSLDEALLRRPDLALAMLTVLRRAPQRNLGAARYAFQSFLVIPSNGDKSFRLLRQRDFCRQALHARRAVEAVALRAPLKNRLCIFGRGDRPAVTKHDDVRVDF